MKCIVYNILILSHLTVDAIGQNLIHVSDVNQKKVSQYCFDVSCYEYYYKEEPFTGTIILDEWGAGNVNSKIDVENGKVHGTYEVYFNSGQIRTIVDHVDGTREGKYLMYHENGQLAWRTSYINGREEGLIETFHENGQMFYRSYYKAGKLHGNYIEYNDKGILIKSLQYKDGVTVN